MLDQVIKANQLAQKVNIRSVSDFILKNELHIEKELAVLVAKQYVFREKLAEKVPEWHDNKHVLGPKKVSVEQSSSEFTARFKAGLFKGKSGADLTGGMGVDAYFLSRSFDHFIYNEADADLTKITEYNFGIMGIKNVVFKNSDAQHLANALNENYDLIYLDPARRDKENKKVIRIEDCEPDLIVLKNVLLPKCRHLMVKYSPLLDIKSALRSLENVTAVKILAEKNEVKELLFILEDRIEPNPLISCVNGLSNGNIQVFGFTFDEEAGSPVRYQTPENYLYEPNAAIMKGGAFKCVAERYKLAKVAPNSHLYTSNGLLDDFPGRAFQINHVCSFDKKEILKHLKNKKANISCRNFPLKPEEIRIKIGLKDGGDDYIFCTQDVNNKKIVLLCRKITR